MAIKWICANCKEKISDGIVEGLVYEKGEVPAIPADWGGICPLCGGNLEDI